MTTATTTRSLDEVRTLVEPAIRSALDRLDHRNRLVAGYQFGYWDADARPTRTGGKGLRPVLALLHDDVMDGDTERRHRPTAWAKFGAGPAILAGDALLVLAQEVLVDAGAGGERAAVRLRADVRRLIAGQAADLEFEHREQVALDECLHMAEEKTASLVSGACALGALLCQAPAGLVDGLSRFGARLGLAFQLVDDLLGIWGDPRRTGKPVGADLRVRKKSIPVVWAVNSNAPAGRELAELYRSRPALSADELIRAADLVERTGARQWTRERTDTELAAALAQLRDLPVPEAVHRELTDLAVFIIERDY